MSTQQEVMISKMSVKGLGCKPFAAPKETPARLCQIIGKASGLKTGEDTTGRVWSAITGEFRGVNLATGEIFRSGKLFLPGGIHEVVEGAVKSLPEDGGVVKFAFEIRTVEAKNPIGYSYQAANLMPMESETDSLADVIAAIAAPAVAAIAAPAVAEVKDTNVGSKKK